MATSLLLIDDDESFREVMRFHLAEEGYLVDVAVDGRDGLDLFQKKLHPVVLTDLKMPRMDGLTLMKEIHKRAPATAVIVITAFGDIETAVEAMRAGAFDFVPKPTSREHFKLVVNKAVEHVELRARVYELEAVKPAAAGQVVYQSAAMERIVDLADRIAGSEATILLTGESGTGKEIIARRVHVKSERSEGPFVPVNCAAIPKELLESELFGHVKGAFTGATRDRKGRFQQAAGGTIFLDEIGELPGDLQPRLLRVLQEHIVDVVGGDSSIPVDVRVIAATNKNLNQAVRQGSFREDLFFRLNVVQIEIPPLRARREDIPVLTDHFVNKHGRGNTYRLTRELMEKLEAYDWPGNVRELENVCQRLVLLTRGEELMAESLPSSMDAGSSLPVDADGGIHIVIPKEGISLEELERTVITEALKKNDHNQSKTARFLKIPRHILLYRMEKYQIPRGSGEGGR